MKGVIRKSLAVAAGLLFLVPASALASEASIDTGGIARLQAFANEVNGVTVGELPGPNVATKTVVFTDLVPIQVQGGCFHPNLNSSRIVHCVVPASQNLVRVALEDENDRLEPSTVNPPTTIRFSSEGGTGNDVMIGTQIRDVLDGEGGLDTLRGRSGNDALEGGNGNDDLRGDAGPDTMLGGAGDDVLNGDDNAGGDSIDCGEDWGDDDFALYNGASGDDPGDLVFSNCERTQEG